MLRRVDIDRFDAEGAGEEGAGIFGLPYDADESSVVLVPVPWEPTTSYGRGTARGPRAILEASPQLDLLDPELAELGLARPWVFGIHMLAPDPQIVAWNEQACSLARPVIERGGRIDDRPELLEARDGVDALGARLVEHLRDKVGDLLHAGKVVGVVGGDHAAAEGAIAAQVEHHRRAGTGVGILHVDAHADLRVAYEGFEHSHASVMHNVLRRDDEVTLVQVGVRDLSEGEHQRCIGDPRITPFFDHLLRRRLDDGEPWSCICDAICDRLPEAVYVSFDIDGLDPTLCPATGTPVPGGLSFGQAMSLLAHLPRRGKRVIGFDLVEVAPGPEGSQWDGNVGARILYRLAGVALLGHGAADPEDGTPPVGPTSGGAQRGL